MISKLKLNLIKKYNSERKYFEYFKTTFITLKVRLY